MTEELNYEEKSYIREIYTKFAPYFHTLVSCASNGYLSASSSKTGHYSHFIGGAMQALVAHSSTGILYRMPEWDLENVANLINVYFKELITPINLWYHEAEKKLDNQKDNSYISFHVTVLVKSTFLSVLSGYSMSSVYSQNNFQDVKEQIIESVKNNNYYRVDELIRYSIPKEKIVEVIDILSKNIKCTKIKERDCKSAIETALKLIDISIDTESRNKSIKLAVSLALSVGMGELITDEVLAKISGDDTFNEILLLATSYLNPNSIESIAASSFAVEKANRIYDEVLAEIKGFSNCSKNSEATIFNHLLSKVEPTKQIQIPIDKENCIKNVQDEFHKAFYGDACPEANVLVDFIQDIAHCYYDNVTT